MYEPCKIFPQNCGRVDQAITVTKKVQAHLQANVEPCKYISFADMLQASIYLVFDPTF